MNKFWHAWECLDHTQWKPSIWFIYFLKVYHVKKIKIEIKLKKNLLQIGWIWVMKKQKSIWNPSVFELPICFILIKSKLYNTSIKSIFGITKLIYFRDNWKMHLSCDKTSFSMTICRKCLERCCFSSKPFLKQLTTLQLKFPGMKFFLIHPGHWNTFFGRFSSFLRSVNERQVITHKKIEKHDGRNVFL